MSLRQYGGSGGSTPYRSYTIGVAGVAGCDYNFTSVGNANQQSIQLGATAIIPAKASVTSIIASDSVALVGGTATCNVGITSGSAEYIDTVTLSSLNATASSSAAVSAQSTASSIYFSITPSANWNTLSAGKWKVNIFINLFV